MRKISTFTIEKQLINFKTSNKQLHDNDVSVPCKYPERLIFGTDLEVPIGFFVHSQYI